MESWHIDHYDMPRLVPLSVDLDKDGRTVVLSSGSNAYEIVSNEIDGSQLLDSIRSMADPESQLWSDIKLGLAQPWQANLIKKLDELSLVQSKPADLRVFEDSNELCEKLVRKAEAVLIRASNGQHDKYRQAISMFVHALDVPLPKTDMFSVDDIRSATDHDDFALQTFFLQRLYVEENLPIVVSLWRDILLRVGHYLGMTLGKQSSPSQMQATTAGFYCNAHIEAYLMCLVDLLHLATTEGRARRVAATATCDQIETGLNFMRQAEDFALSALSHLGQSRYVTEINDSATQFGPLVQGLFIEQYHVTQRFVEIIAPLMTKRTRSPIKQRIYRYFQEELGHEIFERDTCVALRIAPEKLDKALPLPLFQAYVDAFTVLGRYDAIGYMSSIMVTEGMLGVDNPVHERLEKLSSSLIEYKKVAKRHDDLNLELNHAALSRLFFEELRAISPVAQRRALANLAFLIELNFRAMDQAAEFYGKQHDLTICSLTTYADTLS
ncbi:hypothetical protein ACFSHT_23145 [Paraburkholderia silviterrae]|uniref:Uncharacterized protein n=1 Tax=Paraburkholderia silviterrae TaxID=2528715 RepID=A0A4V2ZY49_9BURK|nr:hypothetical protein [Paraburkholderia silviterrae]TDG18684.1 hypothetical protein EYW47_33390 [Paraburkholderia silviterrae]